MFAVLVCVGVEIEYHDELVAGTGAVQYSRNGMFHLHGSSLNF